MFYTTQQLDMLQGSTLHEEIKNYRASVRDKYRRVKGAVLDKHQKEFPLAAFTEENYVWGSAILDSRSIWWNGGRHLVPMLDLINCKEGPDPSRVHATELDASGRNAITRAGWGFKQGDQIYENYGQPNYIYFMYHGFSLDKNVHDCVKVNFNLPEDLDASELQSRMNALRSSRLRPELTVCIAKDKIPPALEAWIRVAHDVEDAKVDLVLLEYVRKALKQYPTSLEEDEQAIKAIEEARDSETSVTWGGKQIGTGYVEESILRFLVTE
ncbi:unnamed protein product, partial [Symbiodinium sp. KB8]